MALLALHLVKSLMAGMFLSSLTGGRLAGRRLPMSNALIKSKLPTTSQVPDVQQRHECFYLVKSQRLATAVDHELQTGKKAFDESQLLDAIVLRKQLIAREGSVPTQHTCSGWPGDEASGLRPCWFIVDPINWRF